MSFSLSLTLCSGRTMHHASSYVREFAMLSNILILFNPPVFNGISLVCASERAVSECCLCVAYIASYIRLAHTNYAEE